MRLLALAFVQLLYIASAWAQADAPLPPERPDTTAEEAPVQAAPESAGEEAADEAASESPGRVIKIEIIGEKKPATFTLREEHPARQAQRQAELERQRQRLLEARRAGRRQQQERTRRVGNSVRQAEPFRRRPE